MSNRRKNRPFGRAWRDTEFDDEGELLVDARPGRCSRCHRATDIGGLDDSDVFQCGFCRGRTRFLWSDRRGVPVQDVPALHPDWQEITWRDFWFLDDEGMDWESGEGVDFWEPPVGCSNCDGTDENTGEPLPARTLPPFRENNRWFCARCGQEITADYHEF